MRIHELIGFATGGSAGYLPDTPSTVLWDEMIAKKVGTGMDDG